LNPGPEFSGNVNMKIALTKSQQKDGRPIATDCRRESASPKKRKKSKFKQKKKKKNDVIAKQSLQLVASYLQEMGLSELKGICFLKVEV
jgi:hypothetical protein